MKRYRNIIEELSIPLHEAPVDESVLGALLPPLAAGAAAGLGLGVGAYHAGKRWAKRIGKGTPKPTDQPEEKKGKAAKARKTPVHEDMSTKHPWYIEIADEMDRLAQDYESLVRYPLSLGSKRRAAARKFLRALKAFRAAGGKPSASEKRLEAFAEREFKAPKGSGR